MQKQIKRLLLSIRETYNYIIALRKLGYIPRMNKRLSNEKPKILFYHVSGLSFGGTEKYLQILAKHLTQFNYDIYFMYSPKPRLVSQNNERLDGRLPYFNGTDVKMVSFDYDELETDSPYFIRGATPSIFEIIQKENIDLLITAGAGQAEFPFNMIRDIPIILLNIFGVPNVQNNIKINICISNEVAKKIMPVVDVNKIKVFYNQSDGPDQNSPILGQELRNKLGIPDDDIIFGRIGRSDNGIFDPIGIRAFQKIVRENNHIHYIIMSPPPILQKIVAEEKIPNVNFLPPSAKEDDVWAFHQAIDVLAHFRRDGESCGLNIAEAMLCGKPIITHKSTIWNAHLEYLDDSFSRIAEVDNEQQYTEFMKEFIYLKERGQLKELGINSRKKAEELFLINNMIAWFKDRIDEILQ